MAIKNLSNLLISLLLLIGTACMYWQMQQIEVSTVHAMGPNFFPGMLLSLLFFLSLCLAYQSIDFKKSDKEEEKKDTAIDVQALILQLAFVSILILYVFLLPYLSYIPSTILFLSITMTLLGKRTVKDIASYVLIASIVTGIIYYIFGKILLLFLP